MSRSHSCTGAVAESLWRSAATPAARHSPLVEREKEQPVPCLHRPNSKKRHGCLLLSVAAGFAAAFAPARVGVVDRGRRGDCCDRGDRGGVPVRLSPWALDLSCLYLHVSPNLHFPVLAKYSQISVVTAGADGGDSRPGGSPCSLALGDRGARPPLGLRPRCRRRSLWRLLEDAISCSFALFAQDLLPGRVLQELERPLLRTFLGSVVNNKRGAESLGLSQLRVQKAE